MLLPRLAALRGGDDGRSVVVIEEGRDDDGGSVENAAPSWRAQAATTRLTKKDFMMMAQEIGNDKTVTVHGVNCGLW